MLRISSLLREAYCLPSRRTRHSRSGYVVIWNLTNHCNLSCYHCYANANSNRLGKGNRELRTQEAKEVIDGLAMLDVFVLILSGGEPMLRHDLYELAAYAADKGISCALSTNGTLIDEAQVKRISGSGIAYVGISLDGSRGKHDEFRGRAGAYQASLKGIRLCRDAGIKVGLRFSLTSYTASQLPLVIDLFEQESLSKLYVSHMNYSDGAMGRLALGRTETREIMSLLMRKAVDYLQDKSSFREIVTGNNEADAPFLLLSVERESPVLAKRMYDMLMQRRGNGSASQLINIDPWGSVHPDPFCREITLGNIRQTPFSQILSDSSDHFFIALWSRKERFHGRCGRCRFASLCGGNSRARAFAQSSDWWGSDPSCYLTNEEIAMNQESLILSR